MQGIKGAQGGTAEPEATVVWTQLVHRLQTWSHGSESRDSLQGVQQYNEAQMVGVVSTYVGEGEDCRPLLRVTNWLWWNAQQSK